MRRKRRGRRRPPREPRAMRRLGDTERARRDLRVRARLERSPARPARGARALAHRIRHGIRTRRTHRIRLARPPQARSRRPALRRARHPPSPRPGFSLSPASRRHPPPAPAAAPMLNPNSSTQDLSHTARAVRIAASRRAVPPRAARSPRAAPHIGKMAGARRNATLVDNSRENNSLLKSGGDKPSDDAEGGGLSARLGRGALHEKLSTPSASRARSSVSPPRASSVRIPLQRDDYRRFVEDSQEAIERRHELRKQRRTPVRRGPSWRSPAPGSYRAGCCSGRTRRTPRRWILFLRLYCWWYHSADQNFAAVQDSVVTVRPRAASYRSIAARTASLRVVLGPHRARTGWSSVGRGRART